MDTSKPTRRVLYSDTAIINLTLEGYKKALDTFQVLLEDLATQGVPVDDSALFDLHDNEGTQTIARLKEAIESEVNTQKFPAMKDTIRKQLAPLYTSIAKAVDAIDAALYYSTYSGSAMLSIDHFQVKDGKVSLTDDMKQDVTDQHTIYSDADPVLTAAYERAEKLADEITDFNRWLHKHGDFITPIGGERPFLNVSIQSGYRVEVEPRALLWIHRKQPKI